jgi:pyrimidine nucleoside transport protein
MYILVVIGIITFLAFDTKDDRRRLVSAGGILALVLIAFIFSKHRKEINWRQVTWGLVLQFIFGLGILRWKPGRLFFECIGQKVDIFLSFTDVGSSFLYGPLITQQPFLPQRLPNDSIAFNVTTMINEYQAAPVVVVFKALSVIYFFSFVISMLFYLGYIQNITLKIVFQASSAEFPVQI